MFDAVLIFARNLMQTWILSFLHNEYYLICACDYGLSWVRRRARFYIITIMRLTEQNCLFFCSIQTPHWKLPVRKRWKQLNNSQDRTSSVGSMLLSNRLWPFNVKNEKRYAVLRFVTSVDNDKNKNALCKTGLRCIVSPSWVERDVTWVEHEAMVYRW